MASDKLLDDEAWHHAEMIVAAGWQPNEPHYFKSRRALAADRDARIAQAQADAERIAALEGEVEQMRRRMLEADISARERIAALERGADLLRATCDNARPLLEAVERWKAACDAMREPHDDADMDAYMARTEPLMLELRAAEDALRAALNDINAVAGPAEKSEGGEGSVAPSLNAGASPSPAAAPSPEKNDA